MTVRLWANTGGETRVPETDVSKVQRLWRPDSSPLGGEWGPTGMCGGGWAQLGSGGACGSRFLVKLGLSLWELLQPTGLVSSLPARCFIDTVPNSCKHKADSYLVLCFVLFKTPDNFDQYGKSRCNYSFGLKKSP